MFDVCHIDLPNWAMFGVNVGNYCLHGAYGYEYNYILFNDTVNDREYLIGVGKGIMFIVHPVVQCTFTYIYILQG